MLRQVGALAKPTESQVARPEGIGHFRRRVMGSFKACLGWRPVFLARGWMRSRSINGCAITPRRRRGTVSAMIMLSQMLRVISRTRSYSLAEAPGPQRPGLRRKTNLAPRTHVGLQERWEAFRSWRQSF